MSTPNFFVETPVATIPYAQIKLLVAYQSVTSAANNIGISNGVVTINPANFSFDWLNYKGFS